MTFLGVPFWQWLFIIPVVAAGLMIAFYHPKGD